MNASIHEVAVTLIEALVIVMLVIFAFLGSPRSVLIPVVAIPLSLVGTLGIMLALGFSINLLTLLALVLAIGLVVDDAIIVVENVNRHLEDGMAPLAAAMQAARELGTAIVAMTVVLLAVYIPIGFQGGLTGALFTEFVVHAGRRRDRFGDHRIDALADDVLEALAAAPRGSRRLGNARRRVHRCPLRAACAAGISAVSSAACTYTPVTAMFVVLVLVSIAFLYRSAKSELAPQEDQGFVLSQPTSAPDATLQRKVLYGDEAYKILQDQNGHAERSFKSTFPGQSFIGLCWRRSRNGRGSTESSKLCSKSWQCRGGQPRSRCFNSPRCPALRSAGAIRHQDHRTRAAPERGVANLPRRSAQERHVHVHRHRPEISTCRSR